MNGILFICHWTGISLTSLVEMRRPRGRGNVELYKCNIYGLSIFSTVKGLFSHQRSSQRH